MFYLFDKPLFLLHRLSEIARMIRGGSLDCYLLVTHHALELREHQVVDYLFRMTWMMVTFRVLLMLMMLTLPMFCQGTLWKYLIVNSSTISAQLNCLYKFHINDKSPFMIYQV